MAAPPVPVALEWLEGGDALVAAAVATLADPALAEPSALPGWSRAHVIAHLARNADACVNLLEGARTGEPRSMYSSPDQRNADIEAGAKAEPGALRTDLHAASRRFAEAAAAMPAAAWDATVTGNSGRQFPASAVPWVRAREVWVHAVDLDAGPAWAAIPDEVARALMDEQVERISKRPGVPAATFLAEPEDEPGPGTRWSVGGGGVITVTGRLRGLLAWLLGRSTGRDLTLAGANELPDFGGAG